MSSSKRPAPYDSFVNTLRSHGFGVQSYEHPGYGLSRDGGKRFVVVNTGRVKDILDPDGRRQVAFLHLNGAGLPRVQLFTPVGKAHQAEIDRLRALISDKYPHVEFNSNGKD